MKYILSLCVLFSLLLVGCGQSPADTKDLAKFMQSTLASSKGKIAPIPAFKNYELFSYDASPLRSPFSLPDAIANEKKENININSGVEPDPDRVKEYLEQFELSSLRMVGNLQKPGGDLWALISDPKGNVVRIKRGEYMGKNHGRVDEIQDGLINIVEIVPNGLGGWLERPKAIAIKGVAGE